jgi:hypothetical protein
MPQITKTITLELEVTVSFEFDQPEPDLGIYDVTVHSEEIAAIEGFIPTIQLNTKADLNRHASTALPMKLTPWLQFSDEMEKEILDQLEDDLAEAAREWEPGE